MQNQKKRIENILLRSGVVTKAQERFRRLVSTTETSRLMKLSMFDNRHHIFPYQEYLSGVLYGPNIGGMRRKPRDEDVIFLIDTIAASNPTMLQVLTFLRRLWERATFAPSPRVSTSIVHLIHKARITGKPKPTGNPFNQFFQNTVGTQMQNQLQLVIEALGSILIDNRGVTGETFFQIIEALSVKLGYAEQLYVYLFQYLLRAMQEPDEENNGKRNSNSNNYKYALTNSNNNNNNRGVPEVTARRRKIRNYRIPYKNWLNRDERTPVIRVFMKKIYPLAKNFILAPGGPESRRPQALWRLQKEIVLAIIVSFSDSDDEGQRLMYWASKSFGLSKNDNKFQQIESAAKKIKYEDSRFHGWEEAIMNPTSNYNSNRNSNGNTH